MSSLLKHFEIDKYIRDIMGEDFPLSFEDFQQEDITQTAQQYAAQLQRDRLELLHAGRKSAATAALTWRLFATAKSRATKAVLKKAATALTKQSLTTETAREALSRALHDIFTEAAAAGSVATRAVREMNEEIVSEVTWELVEGGLEEGTRALTRYTGRDAARELAEQATSPLAQAKLSLGSAITVGLLLDLTLLLYSAGTKYHQFAQGTITRSELCRHVITRSSAAAGSISLSAAGSFVGALVFPGVGTFVGSMVGGLLGEMGGAEVGERLHDMLGESFH